MASEVTFTEVEHDGVRYAVDTPVADIKGLSADQKLALRAAGAIGEPAVPTSVQNELEKKNSEVEALRARIAELENERLQEQAEAEAKLAAKEAEKK